MIPALPIRLPLPDVIPLAGPLAVSGFGLTFLAAAAAGLFLANRALRRIAREPEGAREAAALAGVAPYLAAFAWLGARVLNQIANPDWFWSQPITWVHVDGRTLSFVGAALGTGAGLAWLVRGRRLGWDALDALAGPAAAALAVGWLGMPGTGSATHLPWAVPVEGGAGAHPVQLYGAFGFAALAGYLYWQRPRRDYAGQNVLTFAALAFALRLFVEFLVVAPAPWYGLTTTQVGDAAGLGLSLAVAAWAGRARQPGAVVKRPAAVALAVLVLASAFLAFAGRSAPAVSPAVGFQAPDFTLPRLDGGSPVRLSDLRGRPAIVNFWASWCAPCRAEMPRIQQFVAERGVGGQVVGVDFAEPAATVRDFTRSRGFAWTFALDAQGAVRARYAVRWFPTTFFLDSRGVITRIVTGPMSYDQLVRYWSEAGGR